MKTLLLFLLLLVPVVAQVPAIELPTKTIAILSDGEPSPYFDTLVENILGELRPLARDQYHLEVLPIRPANSSLTQIKKSLLDALEDPAIDAIFTAGITASHAAMRLPAETRAKPVIAGSIEFSSLARSLVTPDGTSTIPHFSFVLLPDRLAADLKTLSTLAATRTIHILVEQRILDTLGPDLTADLAAFEKTHHLQLHLVPISKSDLSLANLPASAKAVYLPLLPALTTAQRHSLFKTLARKKILHLSVLGPDDTEAGAFASLAPRIADPLRRRFALNLHQALLGVDTSHLPVALQLADTLTINLATARKIGWSPDYDTALTANFLHQDEVVENAGTLTLEAAMATAAGQSPDIAAAKAAWQSSLADAQKARAGFSTTASLNGSAGNQINTDRRNSFTVPANAQAVALGLEINRLLYSNQLFRQIDALDQIAASTDLNATSVTLDTIQTTGHSYLDSLLAEAIYRILRENVRLVQDNLSLATVRRNIGATNDTDTLRWQASLASARSQLIQADTNRRNARTQLNVALATDTQKHFHLTDITLAPDDTYLLGGHLGDLVSDPAQFQAFIRFVTALATANSPELQAFDHTLLAQGILLRERKIRHLRPQVQLTAGVQRIFQDSTLTRGDAQNEWTVGIGFTLPFLEKDLRDADVRKINAAIAQLEAQRSGASYLIEQRALAACYNMASSHPAIRLTSQALAAAEKNYQAVRQQYSLGKVNVVTLIDAQSSWLAQQQAHAVANYTYLKDTISLQRAIAWYQYDKSPAQLTDFAVRFHDFQKTGSIHVRTTSR